MNSKLNLSNRYKPTGENYDGGMSDAFVCLDVHLDRKVVVKTLKSGVDSKRILDELAALQEIRSKHVVQIFDVIKAADNTIKAIVQEYIPGNDLTKLPPPQSELEIFRTLYPIIEGIRDIHRHGRIHRDIKRQNMKYDAEGCLKIFDFGLARDQSGASTVGEKGTPGYMAPELFEMAPGVPIHFTAAIDIFAFGATALAILIGKVPNGLKQIPPVLPCPGADFSKLPVPLPSEIAIALNRCLAAKPSDRPTAEDLTNLLATYMLRGQHRALIVSGTTIHTLDAAHKAAKLAAGEKGTLNIAYNDLRFLVTSVSGHVTINNMPVQVGFVLPGSCVIVLGSPALQGKRVFVTVDVSHPEVVL